MDKLYYFDTPMFRNSTAMYPNDSDLLSPTTCELHRKDSMSTSQGEDGIHEPPRFDAPTTEVSPADSFDSCPDGDGDDHLFDGFTVGYALRPQTRATNQSFTCTWIDQDDTGDFDPSEEQRKVRAERTKVRLRQRHGISTASGDEDKTAPSGDTSVRERVILTVKLKVLSEAGKASLQDCLSKPPTGNEHSQDENFDTYGYQFRSNTKPKSVRHRERTENRKTEHEVDLPDDLTGYPAARGCRACLDLGIHCPLLDDEHAWPCHTCNEDDTECELITTPDRKRACEGCKRPKTVCSYTYTLDHSGPCQGCAERGHHCVAGPDKDGIRTRIRYERDWAANPLPLPKKSKPLKTYWTCLHCRHAGRECSFMTSMGGDDCTACEMAGNICIFEQTTTPPKASMTVPARPQKRCSAETGRVREETPTKRPKLAFRKAKVEAQRAPPGNTTTIFTKLCHPIVFNDETAACNFCDGSSMAMLGLEQTAVEVIDWENGGGLKEVGGGHKANGHTSTRVCTICTMQRMPIIMCPKHRLRPIPGTASRSLDTDGALTALFAGRIRKKDRWCSICPALATYECETAQEDTGAFERPGRGCGLQLCETCMPSLAGVYKGDLQAMLGELTDEFSDERPLGLRADFELLKQDGLLTRYILWASEQ
ncbi:hypothetical protein LTR91_001501 [Friedmanniomyces endolithicus]|uniref:Zn(2)-C6 fungal-type domain-containing protein n=1 Tax=Friedmanniomyces endolithicus TaxID=329885 RepID=A0AAN6R1M4_9PEZI|nr:hypothetical protein LTR35_006984 [Friedmanniomyces endolithicus]KAK0296148.1 hypothetical protein LTS00_005434 [Friedmanniomyces endolithicus]KAK0327878.1 hypothetical protein LTR82_001396 [Friedmanniomyces endolithicus]KAK0923639.1 hypothetical protein LTR57_006572 [Friedmanniomyces endolithicus]KAK0977976.1 hypothetical protein LTS01_012944 [Friedmanniomyces endolithicus]